MVKQEQTIVGWFILPDSSKKHCIYHWKQQAGKYLFRTFIKSFMNILIQCNPNGHGYFPLVVMWLCVAWKGSSTLHTIQFRATRLFHIHYVNDEVSYLYFPFAVFCLYSFLFRSMKYWRWIPWICVIYADVIFLYLFSARRRILNLRNMGG